MGFKRAQWHSGLTYRQACSSCRALIEYTDEVLDFRPWYADGFVYCPQCRTPLRHSENYAVAKPDNPVVRLVKDERQMHFGATVGVAKFCNACGRPFAVTDHFCSRCGKKRVNR